MKEEIERKLSEHVSVEIELKGNRLWFLCLREIKKKFGVSVCLFVQSNRKKKLKIEYKLFYLA